MKKIGKVKWFSKDKGYGFIYVKEENKDYYFNIRDVLEGELPSPGDKIEFTETKGKKGIKATDVKIIEKSTNNSNYVICPHCDKKIVPRIVYYNGTPIHSVCPFCGNTYKEFKEYGEGAVIIIFVFVLLFLMIFLYAILI